MDLIIQSQVLGIDTQLPVNLIDDRSVVDGTQNIDFDDGVEKTPPGFALWDCASPILSEKILALAAYTDISDRQYALAALQTKLYRHNYNLANWTELGDLDADIFHAVSFATVLHQDAIDSQYQHLIVCDGRNSIKRWYGEGDTLTALAGGDGYNIGGETSHRAMQVAVSQNRLILINPYEYSGVAWIPNTCRVRWPQQARLEKQTDGTTSCWTGTGSGFSDLRDTGDTNVRAELLGNVLVVYQKHSVWQLRWVGGTTVFVPDILLHSLGLLSYHLLCSIGDVHYFVGNDYNIYSYSGGTGITDIGQKIAPVFKRDLAAVNNYRCRMTVGPQGKFLYIFIVTGSNEYATTSYKLNLRTGAWTVREFSHIYTTTASGITAAALIGAATYQVGQTYAQAITGAQTYAEAVVVGTTYRQVVTDTRVEEKLSIGDSDGYVLQEDEAITTDNTVEPTHYSISKEFDGGYPTIRKRVDEIFVDAKGTSITLEYKLDGAALWTSIGTITLAAGYATYRRFINRTCKKIQLRSSGVFTRRSWGLRNVQPEVER